MLPLSSLLAGRRILVVDDASFILTIVGRLLREMGCAEVLTASGGMQALSLLHATQGQEIDAIVLDLHMPDLSGMKILRMIRSGETPVARTMPVIMLTSGGDEEQIRLASRLRVDAFLIKPISKALLGMRIEKVLSSRIAGPPIPPPGAARPLPALSPAPRLPAPRQDFARFEAACEAAILRRVSRITTFFQRDNPALRRDAPPLFLGSPDFRDKLDTILRVLIIPKLLENQTVLELGGELPLSGLDSETFWARAGDRLRVAIQLAWDSCWDELRLVEEKRGGKAKLGVKELTKLLRRLLPPGDEPYYQPKIGNAEIDLFKSLLDTDLDWRGPLDALWDDLHGARDDQDAFAAILLKALDRFPTAWMDALALSCHRVFPRIDNGFLGRFAEKKAGVRRMPYTAHLARAAIERREKVAV